jgi:hypothetical protein
VPAMSPKRHGLVPDATWPVHTDRMRSRWRDQPGRERPRRYAGRRPARGYGRNVSLDKDADEGTDLAGDFVATTA